MKIILIIIGAIIGAIVLFFIIIMIIDEISVLRKVKKENKYQEERGEMYLILAQMTSDKLKFINENKNLSDAQIQKHEKWILFEKRFEKANARIKEINGKLKKLN